MCFGGLGYSRVFPAFIRCRRSRSRPPSRAKKEVIVGGAVCLDEGPIEYFACPKDTKDYESLVAVRSSARLVHTAMLAIGLQPGSPVSFDP